MSENFFNKSINTSLNKPFGMNIIPERTMQQVKESALNLLKDVVRPITDIGVGKEEVLNGSIAAQIITYNNVANMVMSTMAAADDKNHRTLDIKL